MSSGSSPGGAPSCEQRDPISLVSPAGRLESIYRRVPGAATAVVLCHSHPHHGGSMYDKVLYHAARALHAAGASTLRFNFRGTGDSEGAFDGGDGEAEDVRAAIALAGRDHADVAVVGYSFGAWIGMRVGAAEPRVSRLVGLGAPVDVFDHSYLDRVDKPVLLVHGERDQWGSLPALSARYAAIPAPKRIVVLAGEDHFFGAHLPATAMEVARFVTSPVTG